MKVTHLLVVGVLFLVSAEKPAAPNGAPKPAVDDEGVQVYFSPKGGCTEAIVHHLGNAKKSVLVAAFTITSTDIAKAIKAAHERGVTVRVCLDPTQATAKYSSATYLDNAAIEVWIDRADGLQHNKYVVIDDATVITGSFNFTQSAEERNAENLMVLTEKPIIARAYAANFRELLQKSRRYVRKE